MNKTLIQFARQSIKEGLKKLSEEHRLIFRRMYAHHETHRTIEEIVDRLPEEKLSWALTQIENSLRKLEIE